MADWRIVTPTRAPRDDELNRPSGMAPGTGTVLISPGNISIMFSQNKIGITYQNVQPVVRYFYDFTTNEWQDTSYTPIDITSVDLTIPEAAVSSATNKSSYFDLIAYEKGTTACKLAVTNEAKTLIRNALINKGADVPDTTPFRQYAGKVGEIQSAQFETQEISDSFTISVDSPDASKTVSVADGWAPVGYDLHPGDSIKSAYATYDHYQNTITYGGSYTGYTSAGISIDITIVKTM